MKNASLKPYLFALGDVLVASLVCFALDRVLQPINLVMIYLLGTLVVAVRGHRGSAALSAALSVLAFDFFFVPPRLTFTVEDAQFILTFVAMFMTAMVVSHLARRLRMEADTARESERRTALMYAINQRLAGLRDTDAILKMSADLIRSMLEVNVSVYLPDDRGQVAVRIADGTPSSAELQAAQWVYENGRPSGAPSTTLPLNATFLAPIRSQDACVGVIGVRPTSEARAVDAEQRALLDSLARQIGMAMEVGRLDERSRKAEIETETERLRSTLLSSVSHDLQTPLAAIVGSADALLGKEDIRRSPGAIDLLENIQEEGDRLSRLVKNLLQTTRLQSGTVQLKKERYPLEEIVGTALERVQKILTGRTVTTEIPDWLPPVPVDAVLFEQAIINLLENAARHTPAGTGIEISAGAAGGFVEISVSDHGKGLSDGDLERVFEKFYRQPASSGTGLGLTICRAIVEAHGGRVWAENRPGGGAVFKMTIPSEGAHAA